MSDIQDLVSDPVFVAAPPEKQASVLNVFFNKKLESVPDSNQLSPALLSQAKDAFVKKFMPDPRTYLLGGATATIGPAPKAPPPAAPAAPDESLLQKATGFVKSLPGAAAEGAIQGAKAAVMTPLAPFQLAKAQTEQELKEFNRRGIIQEGKGTPRSPLESAAELALRGAMMGGVVNRSDEPRSLKNTLLDILDIGSAAGGLAELAPIKAARAARVINNISKVAEHLNPEDMQLLGKVKESLAQNPVAAEVLKGSMPAEAAAPVLPAAPAVRPPPVAPAATTGGILPTLPKDLAGAKPRYQDLSLRFQSDIDRAAYITAQANPSARDADYLKFVMNNTGMNEAQVRAYGKQMRTKIGSMLSDAEDGELRIPRQDIQAGPAPAAPGRSPAPQVNPPEPTIPVVQPTHSGEPYGVFSYNSDMNVDGQMRSLYTIFGDPENPLIKVGPGLPGAGNTTQPLQWFKDRGIPIVGQEPRAAANGWKPLDYPHAAPEAGPAEAAGGAGGTIPPPPDLPPPPPGGTPPNPTPGASGEVGQFNTARFADLDVRKILEDTQQIPEVQQKIIDGKRGLVTDEQVKQLAGQLEMTPEQLTQMAPGSVLNAEGLYKANQILGGVGKSAVVLGEKYQAAKAAGDTAAMGSLVSDTQRLMDPLVDVLVKTRSIASELGRALRQQRIVIEKLSPIEQNLLNYSIKDGGLFSPDKAEQLLQRISSGAMDAEDITQLLIHDIKPTLLDKFIEFATAAKLTNPVTYIRNTAGNMMAVLTNLSERTAAGPIDMLRSSFTGAPRERYLGEVGAQLFGLGNGLHDAAIQFMATLKGDTVAGKTAEVMRAPAIGGMAGQVISVPFKILNATDDFFKTILRRGELYGQALRQAAKEKKVGADRWGRIQELVANPPEEWIPQIEDKVLEFTYQTPLGELGTYLDKARGTFGGLPKLIVPFFKTPVNIGKFIVQRTPLGVFPGSRNWEAFMRGGGEASEAAARLSVGTALGGLFTWLGLNGYITGAGPTDKGDRDLLQRSGWQPHSLHVGGRYVSFSGFDPLATSLGAAGDIAEAWFHRKTEPTMDTIAKMGWGIADNITDQPFLTGVHDFLDALRDERKMGKFVDSFAAGLVPTGLGLIARNMDPVQRKPVGVIQAMETRIPGLSTRVPPKRDAFGDPVTRDTSFPVTVQKEKSDPLQDELSRINASTGYSVGFRGMKVNSRKLTPEEYDQLSQVAGARIKAEMTDLVQSERYQGLSDAGKKRALKKITHSVTEDVDDEMSVPVELRALGLPAVDKMGLPPDLTKTLMTRLKVRIDSKPYKDKPDEDRKAALKEKIRDVLLNYQGGR